MPINYGDFFRQVTVNLVTLVAGQPPAVRFVILLSFAAVAASIYQRIRWAHLALAPKDPSAGSRVRPAG